MSQEQPPQSNGGPSFCIFCFGSSQKCKMTDEHIIPQCIGGHLWLDWVCKDCNSALGTDVDSKILALPETLSALKALGLPHDRDQILSHHYKVTGLLGGQEVRVHVKNGLPVLIPQQLPDGSMITEEAKTESGPIITSIGSPLLPSPPMAFVAAPNGQPRESTKGIVVTRKFKKSRAPESNIKAIAVDKWNCQNLRLGFNTDVVASLAGPTPRNH